MRIEIAWRIRLLLRKKRNKKKEKKKGKEKRAERKDTESKVGFSGSSNETATYIHASAGQNVSEIVPDGWMRVLKNLLKIIRFDYFNACHKGRIEEPALLGKIYALYTMAQTAQQS